ncbi:Protein MKS1 [Morella rubra]|uniref:Protein MKS1 n=1 Tax=Morella rubra TaxID=262757 RepID=A0A6A1UZ38_9ROSI|nr:Protein MKS1 [Morella rubra]
MGENHEMSSQTRKHELQCPRPTPLTLNKSSIKVKKSFPSRKSRSPVIVYVESPQVIHVRPQEFMGVVQRLTGSRAPSVAAASHSYSSTSSAMVDDETRAMGISSEGQQKYNSTGRTYAADLLLDLPPS